MNWQPIETAPKDGTKVLLLEPHLIVSGMWDPHSEVWWGCGLTIDATHWMPLPEPPKETTND